MPTTSPSATSTQPTQGLGAVWRRAARPGGQRLLPSPRRRGRCPLGRPAGRGNDDSAAPAPGQSARPPSTKSLPSPIRTLTVGPGIPPGRRPAGCRAFVGLDRTRRRTPDAPSPPVGTFTQPRGLSCVVFLSSDYQSRQNCNVFYFLLTAAPTSTWHRTAPCDGDVRCAYIQRMSPSHGDVRVGFSVGAAAGQEVERVGRHREDDLEAFAGAVRGAGQVADQRLPSAPATPRDNMPNPRPPSSLARRIASAMPGRLALDDGQRVPSGVRSRGPNPVPPVVTTSPANPSVTRATRPPRSRHRRRHTR